MIPVSAIPSYLISFICILSIVLSLGCGESEPPVRSARPVGQIPPQAVFTVSPTTGEPGTPFHVDASGAGSRFGEIVLRWDWNGDEVWDTDFSTDRVATHTYTSIGCYEIRLEVSDDRPVAATTRKNVLVVSDEMIRIPAGEFVMGSQKGIGNEDERPAHTIYLDAFEIGKYEVTNHQYTEFLNALGKNDDGSGHVLIDLDVSAIQSKKDGYRISKKWALHPVVGVSWYGATTYAEWAGGRLPTEAEWERAARGTEGREWPWGDVWDVSNANSWEFGRQRTAPVGSHQDGASPDGASDLAGNVYEWVSDWYAQDYYQISPERNPKGPETGEARVLRGGSWAELKDLCRPAARLGQPPESADSDFGFRIAKDIGD